MLMRALLPLRMGPRVQRAPGIPCAFWFMEGHVLEKTRAHSCRENANGRHCEERSDEAIQASACCDMYCFASLAMTRVVRRIPEGPEETPLRMIDLPGNPCSFGAEAVI